MSDTAFANMFANEMKETMENKNDYEESIIGEVKQRVRPTTEEWEEYLNKNYPERPVCCMCGNMCDCPYGNSPAPIMKKGKCCGACNNAVVLVRVGVIPLEFAKKNKKNIKNMVSSFFSNTDK